MKIYTDESHMPFGKYGPGKGDHRRLKDIGADYMIWLWEDAALWNGEALKAKLEQAQRMGDPDFIKRAEERLALHKYMADTSTFAALEMDAPDVVIKHKPT